jgi:hypothetical protein
MREPSKPRIGLVPALALVVALVAMAALLLDLGPFGEDEDARPAVREAVERLAIALSDGDFETVCALLSADQVGQIEQGPGGSCEEVLAATAGGTEKVRIRIEQVRVSDDRAAVDAIVVRGQERAPRTLLLVREEGRWKVASAGL